MEASFVPQTQKSIKARGLFQESDSEDGLDSPPSAGDSADDE